MRLMVPLAPFVSHNLQNKMYNKDTKNVNRLGYKEDYEKTTTDPSTGRKSYTPFRIWVRRLMILAFVPAGEVRDSFYFLLDEMHATSTSMTSWAIFRLPGSRDCLLPTGTASIEP